MVRPTQRSARTSDPDIRLVLAAIAGIALSIVLIVRARLHPFVGLLCSAFAVGLLAGLPAADTAKAVQKGAGDILGGTGLVVVMPIIAAATAALPAGPDRDERRLRIMLPALAGLSVRHALVPPHPGPLLAVDALHASLARTIGYGVAVRLATGSATVATITTAGIMPGLATASGTPPEWIVLAIGAGSLFFSHVNDPGFWLVRGYLGTDTPTTFRTWSIMETVVSVVGLILVYVGSALT